MNRGTTYVSSNYYGCLICGILLCMCIGLNLSAQTYTSKDNNTGLTIHKTSWEGTAFAIPTNPTLTGGSVIVYGYLLHGISGSPDNASFTNPGTKLVVEDTFRIFGNLTAYNSASIHIKPGGVLIVHGNYQQDANVTFNNEGNAVFLGDWKSGINPPGLSNSGNWYVGGTFEASGGTVTPKMYDQLQGDNLSLYDFSQNQPTADECAGINSGQVTFSEAHSNIVHWESSTDFFKSQVTVINNSDLIYAYNNLSKTTSFRAYYKKIEPGYAYSAASTIVVRDIFKGIVRASAKAVIPAPDLSAYFGLDGNISDGSGKSNHGILHGDAVATLDRFGLAGKAIEFDGVDDYISTATHYAYPGPQVFSLSVWFKTITTSGGRLIGFGDQQTGASVNRDRHMYMSNSGQVFFGVYTDAHMSINTTESFNDGQWHHAVSILSPQGIFLYVDGQLKASNTSVTYAQGYPGYWKIGYDSFGYWPSQPSNFYFTGAIDDIHIYNKSLSANEIEELFNLGVDPICEGEAVMLSASAVEGANYSWTGPQGFTSSVQNPLLSDIAPAHGGLYTVTVFLDGCYSQGSTNLVVVPAVQPGSIYASEHSLCIGANSTTLTLQNYIGNIVRWEKSTDGFNSEIITLEHTSPLLNISNLQQTTHFRAVVKSGDCGEAGTLPVSIVVGSPAIGGTINGDSEICFGENSATISVTGHEGEVLRWESSVDNFQNIETIPISEAELTITNLFQTTAFRAVVGNEGSCEPVYSSEFTVNIKPQLVSGGNAFYLRSLPSGNLSAALPFNGTGIDVSGMKNHGRLYGTRPAADRFGMQANALNFNGEDDYIVTSTEYASPGPNVFALSLWFNTTSTTGGRLIGYSETSEGPSSQFDRQIYLNDDGQLYFGIFVEEFWPDSFKFLTTDESYNDGRWHHVVAQLSPSGMKLFVNGELKKENSAYTIAQNSKGYWKIGFESIEIWPGTPTSGYYHGDLDEVLIFERELNSSDIWQLYNAGTELVCEGETLSLNAPTLEGATYSWSGPAAFSSTDQNPSIPNLTGANAGLYSLEITVGGCQAQLTTFVSIIPLVAGGLTSIDQNSFCAAGNTGDILLSGHGGAILHWESSTDGFEENISVINETGAEITFTNLSQTTSFRALVSGGGSCANQYSSVISIQIDPNSVGGVATASSGQVCIEENSGNISLSGYTGAIVRWESSIDDFQDQIDTIALISDQIPFQNLGTTTKFRAIVKSGTCDEIPSSSAEVIVDARPVGGEAIASVSNVCAQENSGTISLSGWTGDIVRWERSTDGFTNEIVEITEISDQISFLNLTATTSFRAIIMSGSCSEIPSDAATITMDSPSVGGELSAQEEACAGANAGTIVLSGHNGAINRWEYSLSADFSDPSTVQNTSTELVYENLNSTTYYRAVIKNGECSEAYSGIAEIKVSTVSGGDLIGSQTVCAENNSGLLSLSGHAGNILRWESSTDDFTTEPTEINHTDSEYEFFNLTESTSFRAIVGIDGVCPEVSSSVVKIEVEPAIAAGNLSSSFTQLCSADNSGTIVLNGASGNIIRWESSVDGFGDDITLIEVETAEYTFENLLNTTSYRALLGNGSSCPNRYTDPITIDVFPVSIGGVAESNINSVCEGTNIGTISLSGHIGDIIRWESSTDNFEFNIVEISSTSSQVAFGDLPETTWFRAVVKSGTCDEQPSASAMVTVNAPSAGGILGGATEVCANSNAGKLNLSGQLGAVLGWEMSLDAAFSSFETVPNNSTIAEELIFENLEVTTYYRALVQNGNCEPAYSSTVEIRVSHVSAGVLSGSATVCANDNSGTLSLRDFIGNILRWEISTDDFATDIRVVDHFLEDLEFLNLPSTTSYRVIVGNGGSCTEVSSSSVRVTAENAPIGGNLSPASDIICQAGSGTISLAGYQGEIVRWESSEDGFETISNINSQLAYHSFDNLGQTTSFRAVVRGEGSCTGEVYSTISTIYVEEEPVGGALIGGVTVCAGANGGELQLLDSSGDILRWESSPDGFTTQIAQIPESRTTYSFQNLVETTSFRAVLGNTGCGEVFSSVVTVVVLEGAEGGILAGSRRILPDNNVGFLKLENHRGEIIQWEQSNDNFSSDIRVLPISNDQLDYHNVGENTWYRVLVGTTACSPVYSPIAEITINNGPEVGEDEFSIPPNTSYSSSISLLENDIDPDGDGLTIVAVSKLTTEGGNTVSIDEKGYFTFEPAAGFSGSDSFQYQVCDNATGAVACSWGTVWLEIETDRKIIVYQGFSPNNGDNKNDKWIIANIEHYPDNLVQVYNRYGVLIFEMPSYNNVDRVFEGFSNRGKDIGGNELPKDTYYYQIRLDKQGEGLTGFVIINR